MEKNAKVVILWKKYFAILIAKSVLPVAVGPINDITNGLDKNILKVVN